MNGVILWLHLKIIIKLLHIYSELYIGSSNEPLEWLRILISLPTLSMKYLTKSPLYAPLIRIILLRKWLFKSTDCTSCFFPDQYKISRSVGISIWSIRRNLSKVNLKRCTCSCWQRVALDKMAIRVQKMYNNIYDAAMLSVDPNHNQVQDRGTFLQNMAGE